MLRYATTATMVVCLLMSHAGAFSPVPIKRASPPLRGHELTASREEIVQHLNELEEVSPHVSHLCVRKICSQSPVQPAPDDPKKNY